MEPSLTELAIAETQLAEAAPNALGTRDTAQAEPASEAANNGLVALNVMTEGDSITEGRPIEVSGGDSERLKDNVGEVEDRGVLEDVDMEGREKQVTTPAISILEDMTEVEITKNVEFTEPAIGLMPSDALDTPPKEAASENAVPNPDIAAAVTEPAKQSANAEEISANDEIPNDTQNNDDVVEGNEANGNIPPEETLTEIAQLINLAQEERTAPPETPENGEAQSQQVTVMQVETVMVSGTMIVETEPVLDQPIEKDVLTPSSPVAEFEPMTGGLADANVPRHAEDAPTKIPEAAGASMDPGTEVGPSPSAPPTSPPVTVVPLPNVPSSVEPSHHANVVFPHASLAPMPNQEFSAVPQRTQAVRRPGPTPSSLAALSVSPGLTIAVMEPTPEKQASSTADREMTPDPPVPSVEIQPASSPAQPTPISALNLNPVSAQVPNSAASSTPERPASPVLPHSAGTLVTVDYTGADTDDADGETDDGEGETDDGLDLAAAADVDAEEEAMNGTQQDNEVSQLGATDNGGHNSAFKERIPEDPQATPSNAANRAEAPASRDKAPSKLRKPRPTGPPVRIIEIVLDKLKRKGPGWKRPVPTDSVAFMLGLDAAGLPASAPRIDPSRSTSILPPPPAVSAALNDVSIGGNIPSSPPVLLHGLTEGVNAEDDSNSQDGRAREMTVRNDRRHWNYDSDEVADHDSVSGRKRRDKAPKSPAHATMSVVHAIASERGTISEPQIDLPLGNGLVAQVATETGKESEVPVAAAPLAISEPVRDLPSSNEPMAMDDDPSAVLEQSIPDQPSSATIKTGARPTEAPIIGNSLPTVAENGEDMPSGSSLPALHSSMVSVDVAGTPVLEANGDTQTGGNKAKRPRPRPKKAEMELNEALLALATSYESEGDDAEASAETASQPAVALTQEAESAQPVAKPKRKPRKSQAPEPVATEAAVPASEQADVPAPVEIPVPSGPPPRRKLKMEQTWFDPDQLPTAVPYSLRYYLSSVDGQPIVSWRDAEPSGIESSKPEGTLYANGFRVNPEKRVDEPADRRANNACEWCRFSVQKCDGYGDRPCSACCKSKRSLCVYKPWSTAEQREHDLDVEAGYKKSEVAETQGRGSRRLKQDPPAELEMTTEDEKVVQSMLTFELEEVQPLLQHKETTSPPVVQASQTQPKSKMKKPKILAAASSPNPERDTGVSDVLEVVIDVPKKTEKSKVEVEKPSNRKRAQTTKAKRKKIEEHSSPTAKVHIDVPVSQKRIFHNGTIPRRKMQKQQDWFDPDELPVSVPHTVRYYIAVEDGQPIISWRDPGVPGEKSQLPAGTLFANGSMVNAAGFVDVPADRMANHACEACRLSNSKCDGYGDRPCSACMKSRKQVCTYKPWTAEEQQEHQAALEYGSTSKRRHVNSDSHDPTISTEFQLTETDHEIIRSMLTDYIPEGHGLETESEIAPDASDGGASIQPTSAGQDVEVEIELPVYSAARIDAPWFSLSDAEASQLNDEPSLDEPLLGREAAAVSVSNEPASPPINLRKRKNRVSMPADQQVASKRMEAIKPLSKKPKLTEAQQGRAAPSLSGTKSLSTQSAMVDEMQLDSHRSMRHSKKHPVEPPSLSEIREESKRERLTKKRRGTQYEPIDVNVCFAGLTRRRKLKLVQDWFDPDALPVAVPYTMRYYLMPRDGQAVVSAASPEEAGVKSWQPEGTLYEDGNRVGPHGSVDAATARRAKQACEWCRINIQKCDGYGDRPCSACTKARKPVCVYEPCSQAEYLQHIQNLEQGLTKRRSGETQKTRSGFAHIPVELQTTKQDRVVLEAMLTAVDERPSVSRSQRARAEPETTTSQRSNRGQGTGPANAVEIDEIDLINEDAFEEPEQDSYQSSKPKKASNQSSRAMSRRQFDNDASTQNNSPIETVSIFGDVWEKPVAPRKLNIPPENFFIEDLPISVPYPIRYYMSEDGEPIVSWHKPEADGVRSKRLVGTLYENGNRVNPKQLVDLPMDRRANHACEWCRFNFTKCDGYGDRPCTACCQIARRVCVYRPWTTDDFRNYLMDIGEGDETPGSTNQRRAFNVTKALPDLGASARDEMVIKSMLFASPADVGTTEYQEAAAKMGKMKKVRQPSRVRSLQSSTPSQSVEADVPSQSLRPPKSSKRKPGWLPPQAGAASAWSQEVVSPGAGTSQALSATLATLVDTSRTRDTSRRNKGKAKAIPERVTRSSRNGGSGMSSDVGGSKPRSSRETPVRKRRRIVSSTPELDPDVTDTLYAEMAYPESFERSRDWASFDDLLGIEDNESDSDIDRDQEYLYEAKGDDGENWVSIKPTAGLRVVIELEKGVQWGPEIVPNVLGESDAMNVDEQNDEQPMLSKPYQVQQIDVDTSLVEDLLPTEN